MRLLLLVLAVCTVGRCTIQSSKLLDFEYYWRDWNVTSSMPEDAVAGGADVNGYTTYVARTVFRSKSIKYTVIIPGKASPEAKKMSFENNQLEHTKTKDVEILCALNQNRLKWVAANSGDTVDRIVGDNVLIFGGSYGSNYVTIGRQKIGNETQVGKLLILNGKFSELRLCQNGKGWGVHKGYQVLVYVKDEIHDDEPIINKT